MKFDDLLQYIGEFGPYQRRTYILVCIPAVFAAFHKLGWVFLGAVPPHRCRLSVYDDFEYNQTYHLPESVFNWTIPWDEKNLRWSRCEMFSNADEDFRDPLLSQKREKCHSWVYDKSEYLSTVVTEFDLVCDRNWLRALVHSLYLVGEFLGCTLLSWLSDRIGRKKVLFISLCGQGACGILAGVFRNYYAFIFFRTLVGMFTHAMFLASFTLAVEFVGPNMRPVAGTAVNYFFTLGYFATAGIAYLLREWTYLHMALSASALAYIFVMRWVPESARWLMSMKRMDEAMIIIRKAAELNHKSLPETALKTEPEKPGPAVSAMDLMWNPSVRVKVLIMCYAWFVNSAVYFGLSLNTSNLGGDDYLNFIIAAFVEIPAYTLCIFTLMYFGRRIPLCMSMGIGGIALISTVFFPVDMTAFIITLAMVGKFCISMSYAIIYIFAAELYPTQTRNVALGINSTFSRLGGMITSFIILLGDYWKPLPLIILGVMSLSASIFSLLLPETHCKALPETFAEASELMTTNEEGLIFRRESKVNTSNVLEMDKTSKAELDRLCQQT